MANKDSHSKTPQPVAYDVDGRPLYHHPPQAAQVKTENDKTVVEVPATQTVHFTRSINPEKPHIPESTKFKHDESKRRYPHLNLSDGEYVITAVRRHPIGLVSIWAVEVFAILLIVVFWVMYLAGLQGSGAFSDFSQTLPSIAWVTVFLLFLAAFFVLIGIVGTVIYLGNRFFLTNESVIQYIQTGLFSRNEQTVGLANIEDASFKQHGIIQHILDYGSLRLSTEGDETTYRFSFASHPKKQIAELNNAIEAFKNGRPIEDN